MNLFDTITLMSSEDYKEQFKAEYWQLYWRINELNNMLDCWDSNKLNVSSKVPRYIYEYQLDAMCRYMDMLKVRAKLEKIEI